MIERVTEVKRMEQEEALKASEAATKRLINIRYHITIFSTNIIFPYLLTGMNFREKRGKLSALYSVEDNDEIEWNSNSDECGIASSTSLNDPVDSSPASSVFNGDNNQQVFLFLFFLDQIYSPHIVCLSVCLCVCGFAVFR